MRRTTDILRASLTAAAMLSASLFGGCSEVRGRGLIQEGNKRYKEGNYKEAVAAFEDAEKLVPDLPVLWLNKGFTCRQMLIPGAKTPENVAASKCALTSFKRYRVLAPQDTRGETLYVQTLFDSDEFETLSKMYEEGFKKNPKDIDAVNGLIQVYSKWNKLDEALDWYSKKADLQATDAETQYAVGVFLWQQLTQKGGGPDKASYDPRIDPAKPKAPKFPPAFGYGDIIRQQRVDLADQGIKFLNKAIELRPKYHEAMTYLNLLNRQKSFAFFDEPDEWQKCINESTRWACKAIETQGKTPPPSCLKPGEAPPAGTPGAPVVGGPEGGEPEDEAVAPKETKKSGKSAGKGKKAARKGKRTARK